MNTICRSIEANIAWNKKRKRKSFIFIFIHCRLKVNK
jgi:hypothetical protein